MPPLLMSFSTGPHPFFTVRYASPETATGVELAPEVGAVFGAVFGAVVGVLVGVLLPVPLPSWTTCRLGEVVLGALALAEVVGVLDADGVAEALGAGSGVVSTGLPQSPWSALAPSPPSVVTRRISLIPVVSTTSLRAVCPPS